MMPFKHIIPLFTLALPMFFASCHKEELSPDSVVDKYLPTPQPSELDTWVASEFVPYNIEVLYRFRSANLPAGSLATPPRPEQVRPVLEAVRDLWIKLYSLPQVGGANFLRDKQILRLTLLGDDELESNGVLLRLWYDEMASNEMFVFGANKFDTTKRESVYRLMRSIHHQFARRLIEQIPYDRDAFALLMPKAYGTLTLPYDQSRLLQRTAMSDFALRRGFYTLYSMASPEVEFAEIVSVLLMHSAVEIQAAEETAARPIDSQNATSVREAEEAVRLLRTKRAFVERYFRESVGISLSRLQLLSLKELYAYYDKHGSR